MVCVFFSSAESFFVLSTYLPSLLLFGTKFPRTHGPMMVDSRLFSSSAHSLVKKIEILVVICSQRLYHFLVITKLSSSVSYYKTKICQMLGLTCMVASAGMCFTGCQFKEMLSMP